MSRPALSFAFDIGTNSIGWCVMELDGQGKPVRILDCGVRVFPNTVKGRILKPALVVRRAARSASRRRDRYLRRRKALVRRLIGLGLLPNEPLEYAQLVKRGDDRPGNSNVSPADPYVLRARGLHQQLAVQEIGRAIMHLAKRRGRHTGGATQTPDIPHVTELGERRVTGRAVRHRLFCAAPDATTTAPPTVSRRELEFEFDTLWAVQQRFYPEILNHSQREILAAIIFAERRQEQNEPAGCTLLPHEPRLRRDDPLYRKFCLLKDINELRLVGTENRARPLEITQRDKLSDLLAREEFVTFRQMHTVLATRPGYRFSREVPGCTGLGGGKSRSFGPMNGHGRYGRTVTTALVSQLQKSVMTGSQALASLNFGRPKSRKRAFDLLPAYGEVLAPQAREPESQRLANDTVHVALNQLRRVCNGLIRRHGKPTGIAIELSRDLKKSALERAAVVLLRSEATCRARERSLRFQELRRLSPALRNTPSNRQKVYLWDELEPAGPNARRSIYSGAPIMLDDLADGNAERDHILPRARIGRSGSANLTIVPRSENRLKRNRAPAEVTEWIKHQSSTEQRLLWLPEAKRWRFGVDAVNQHCAQTGFAGRQLPETRYLARLSAKYLRCLYTSDVTRDIPQVRCVPSRAVSLLRRRWNLDDLFSNAETIVDPRVKNRADHRQHAVDAMIVAAISRRDLYQLECSDNYEETGGRSVGPAPPWSDFRRDVMTRIGDIVVSHKADHGTIRRSDAGQQGSTAGKLHNATA